MSFIIDLRSQVPMYAAEGGDWGGPACIQMAMNGYPPGANKCFVSQQSIWNYIQTYNTEPGYQPATYDYGWYSDPYAVTKALNDLCPPEYHWIDISNTDRNNVLYTLFVWMAKYKYPALVCVWGHDYWSLIVYYETSDDPRNVTNPTLLKIGLYQPSLGRVDYKEIPGSTWMGSPYYWGGPCDGVNSAGESLCGLTWNNKWVGIGEPPEVAGSVHVNLIPRWGEIRVSPDEAVGIAQKALSELLWSKQGAFFRQPDATYKPGSAMLVRETAGSPETVDGEPVRYYIVPFSMELPDGCSAALVGLWRKILGKQNQTLRQSRNNPSVGVSVLVNAHTGDVEEVCKLSRPMTYLSAQNALEVASNLVSKAALGAATKQVMISEPELVLLPQQKGVASHSPVWAISIGERLVYISQEGLVIGRLVFPSFKGG